MKCKQCGNKILLFEILFNINYTTCVGERPICNKCKNIYIIKELK